MTFWWRFTKEIGRSSGHGLSMKNMTKGANVLIVKRRLKEIGE
jgi:hypothetical protein